jgi:hypothetical protein
MQMTFFFWILNRESCCVELCSPIDRQPYLLQMMPVNVINLLCVDQIVRQREGCFAVRLKNLPTYSQECIYDQNPRPSRHLTNRRQWLLQAASSIGSLYFVELTFCRIDSRE